MKLFGRANGKKLSRAGQIRTALAFLLSAAAVTLCVLFVLSPSAPGVFFPLAVRFCMSPLDTGDNGVSDWYPAYGFLDGTDDYALSLLPDIPAGYATAVDYLRYLNRDRGVTAIVLDIPPEAAVLLNEGLVGGLDTSYYSLVAGTFCASVEFRDFCSDLRLLNSVLLPDSRFFFVGIAGDEAALYREAAESLGTCLLMSRDEAHSAGRTGDILRGEGETFVLTDFLYTNAELSSGERYSDFFATFLEEGSYIAVHSGLSFLRSWRRFALRASGRTDAGFTAVDGPDGDFFVLVAGSDRLWKREQTENPDLIDYEFGPDGLNPDDGTAGADGGED
jgi:hypothetical protein